MIDLTKCAVESLRVDDRFILYRAREMNASRSVLALVPRKPTMQSLEKLENEFVLATDLDPAWAVLPIELVPHKESMMLLLDDPGGGPLARVIANLPDFESRLRLSISLTEAVSGLHQRKLLHRDIKPGNILVADDKKIRLTGFGNAVHLAYKGPTSDLIAGSLPYTAPEQTGRIDHPVDSRSDLYALGITLYELFTGVLPFSATTPEEWIHCHVVRSPLPPCERTPDLPVQISNIILKLLSKEPEKRYQSAQGLAVDLEECLTQWTSHRHTQEFSLGKYDSIIGIPIPRTLYGRTSESAALRAIFDCVRDEGKTIVALISGPSGVGKSSLVQEFQSGLAPKEALIATGKFDALAEGVPYAALSQAFGSLLRQILTYDESEVAAWRKTLADAVGSNGHLVAGLNPAFELLTGWQAPPADLSPQDRLNLLRVVFRRLVAAFARPGHPLVLFVDDLQWLDVATLDLVCDLVARQDVSNLMLIGAYRDNDVGPLHPLMPQLNAIKAAGVLLEEMTLQPLTPSEISSLVADTLGCRHAQSRPLANLVHSKTGGNPFFATHFLRALGDEGLLTYDPQDGKWRWDIARVGTKGLTDSVADLMTAKLNLLPRRTRQVLLELSFLGNAARLEHLAAASGRSERDIVAGLRPAVQTGLVVDNNGSYAFAHDRIQEAVYGLTSAESKPVLHLRLGTALAEHMAEDKSSEFLYIIANQLNRGIPAIATAAERERIIDVNLAAGQRARTAAAYNAAIAYLKIVQELLGDDAQPRRSQRAFAIALLRAECELIMGHAEAAEQQLLVLAESCPNLQARSEVTRLQANLYTSRARFDRAVDACLAFLRLIGIEWQAHPADLDVDREGGHLRSLSDGLSDAELYALPQMTDPVHRATMAVLADLITPALLTDLNLSNIVILAASRLTLQYGIFEGSSYPLACAFSVLHIRYADAKAGLRLARFAASLAERWPQLRLSGRTLMVFGQFVIPWVQSIRSAPEFLHRSLEIASATGDFTWVNYSRQALVSSRFFSGDPLPEVYSDVDKGIAFAAASNFLLYREQHAALSNLAAGLMGRDNENCFEAPDPTVPLPTEGASLQSICFDYLARIQMLVLAGHPEAAVALAEKTPFRGIRAYVEIVEYRFYAGIAHAAAYDVSPAEGRDKHLDGLRLHHQEISTRCAYDLTNFRARLTLLAAEIARIERRELEAERLYEEAIHLAREGGFVQIEAIASERAARFYERRGIRTIVLAYLANARDCYARWGADAKVRQLERNNLHLPSSDAGRDPHANHSVPLHQLDINALFKASFALSREIALDSLIRTLMRVVVEHAAADRSILFLMRDNKPEAVAEARLGADGIDVTVTETGFRDIEFSSAILNYVIRTQTSFNSIEPANNSLLLGDSYLRKRRRISLYCLPIVSQAKVIGALYLESQLAVGAFTPQRAAVLELLAAQAAISLENARLYSNLESSEAFLAEGQSISHTGSWSWSAQAGKLIWSEEHYRIFGFTPEAGRTPTIGRIYRMVHPEDRSDLRSTVQSCIRRRETFTCEFRMLRSDGALRHLHVVGRPSLGASGNLKNYVGTTVDLSEYRRAQEALEATQANLAHASRLTTIGELTSLIAHEVHQPLTAIATRAGACRSWLSHDPPDVGKADLAAGQIVEYAHHAANVIESIRQMTRKSMPTRTPLNVNDAIRETALLLGGEIRRQRVLLKLDLADDLPDVLGDPVQLQQVIMNLMVNGIEAMSAVDGRLRSLALGTKLESAGTVAVSVADAGIGLPNGITESLFERFFTTKPNGMGIGLTICKSIIEAHGGTLSALGSHPHGSIFRFSLPIA